MAHSKALDDLLEILKNAPRGKLKLKGTSHLVPEDSSFRIGPGGMVAYELLVADILLGAAEREAKSIAARSQFEETAGMVCVPSREPEWALRITGDRIGSFWVVLTEAVSNIWGCMRTDETLQTLPSVKGYRAELGKELGAAVCDIWREVLSQTRHARHPVQLNDGVTYHFVYFRQGVGTFAGKTSPLHEGTAPGRLAGIARILRDFVRDPENQDAFLQALKDNIAWFQSHSHRARRKS